MEDAKTAIRPPRSTQGDPTATRATQTVSVQQRFGSRPIKNLMVDMAERQVLYDDMQEQEAERAVYELQKVTLEAEKRTKDRLAENYDYYYAKINQAVNQTSLEKTSVTTSSRPPLRAV